MTFESIVIDRSATGSSEPEGHQQAMIDKVDAQVNTNTESTEGTPERPSWLPEKFQSAEDMAKAYAELEAKQSGKTPETPAATPPVENPPEQQVKEELKGKGLDMAEFTTEFNQKGSLSEESYNKLLAAGYDKNLVDNYIAGQQAVATQFTNTVMSEAGGAEDYAEMTTWAKINMSSEEQDAYNAAVSSGNLAQARLAVAGLKSRFQADNGNEPRLLGGRNSAATADVFESTAQMTAAMKDPRYQKDPAYRASVQAKLGRSNIF